MLGLCEAAVSTPSTFLKRRRSGKESDLVIGGSHYYSNAKVKPSSFLSYY
jgi:hypothetical protein